LERPSELPQRTANEGTPIRLGGWVSRLAGNRLLQRLGSILLVTFGVMLIAFTLIRLIPGDPASILLGEGASTQDREAFRELLGLKGSLVQQLAAYVGGILRGSLGTSVESRQPVTQFIASRLPVTLSLIGVTISMALVLAVPIGILAAIYRRTWFGHLFRITASALVATPTFFSAVVAILLLAIHFNLAPVAGYRGNFPANLRYLWLPALVLCGVQVPVLARVLQSSIVDTLEQEFVETAIVRGLPRRTYVWRYLLRPSLAPTIALLGYIIGTLLGACVIIELIFNLPGIGTGLVQAVTNRDYPTVQGIVFVFGMIVVLVNTSSDLVSEWLDPRLR